MARLATAITILAGCVNAGAADIGSDCCADLEERIAELEATTARKGNRKISLTISGSINQAILGWDDGKITSAYVVTNDNERTRLRFKGKAVIDADWQTGYLLELGIKAANSKRVNQLSPLGFDNRANDGADIKNSVWFLKNQKYGTMYLGTTYTATDRIADSNVSQTSAFAKYAHPEDAGLGMFLRSAVNGELTASDLTWRRIIGDGGDQPGESQRGFSVIKYETPAWNGFSAVTSWNASNFWDAALRYSGQIRGFDIDAGAGYLDLTDKSQSRSVCAAADATNGGDDTSCRQFSGSISVMHQATGLFVNFGGGVTVDGLLPFTTRYGGTGVDDRLVYWAIQAGIERQYFSQGKSTAYGEFYRYDGGAATRAVVGPGDALNPTGSGSWAVRHSDVQVVGAGIAQAFDNASMLLYLSYRHVVGGLDLRQLNGGIADGPVAAAPIDDLDLVLTGAVIRF